MKSGRLEAFSDGVFAIIITIMVLELKVPEGSSFAVLRPLIPKFLSYLLSYVYIGIYWNNHHHLLQATSGITGATLWPNLALLFTLSLIPFTTAWMGENHFQSIPVALYGINLLACAVAFVVLEKALKTKGNPTTLDKALAGRRKEYASIGLYVSGVILAFWLPPISVICFVVVAVIWVIPDKRIERELAD